MQNGNFRRLLIFVARGHVVCGSNASINTDMESVLSNLGVRQAQHVREMLARIGIARIDLPISSGPRGCTQTACIIAGSSDIEVEHPHSHCYEHTSNQFGMHEAVSRLGYAPLEHYLEGTAKVAEYGETAWAEVVRMMRRYLLEHTVLVVGYPGLITSVAYAMLEDKNSKDALFVRRKRLGPNEALVADVSFLQRGSATESAPVVLDLFALSDRASVAA